MFNNEILKSHFQNSSTISSESLITAEWNMNLPGNISKTGVYRYRPFDTNQSLIEAGVETTLNKYKKLIDTYDPFDFGDFYTTGLINDKAVDGGVNDNGQGILTIRRDPTYRLQFDLQECLGMFRPRSGINKARYKAGSYIPNFDNNMFSRPRYYMPSKLDKFKYWSSWRKEYGREIGISNVTMSNGYNYIYDAVPFVVYNEEVPTNRIVVKVQTNIGTYDSGSYIYNGVQTDDPFYGQSNSTVPVQWTVQYLDGNNWVNAYRFDQNSMVYDESFLIAPDGYVELEYGLQIPDIYAGRVIFAGALSSVDLLPEDNYDGMTYLVLPNIEDRGVMYRWNGLTGGYDSFIPEYEWRPVHRTSSEDEGKSNYGFLVTNLVQPDYFIDSVTNKKVYRELTYIKGIRLVVETMNTKDSSFDLIEMSPRLIVNVSDMALDFSIRKPLSDLGTTSLPVGQLLASSGTLTLFDNEQSFNSNNAGSVISKYIDRVIKFSFYEKIRYVDGNNEYLVPIKSLYSEGMPQADANGSTITINLRDLFFHIESLPAPRMLVTDASLSYAVSTILDYIGFSNYKFYRLENEEETIIPYFFIGPDQNVAEVLNQLAVATQSAMFFDEYNDLIVMSKNYLLPEEGDREVDLVLSGNNSQQDTGIVENKKISTLPNILSISSQDQKIYNDGKISYTNRYIQRTYGSLRQANLVDSEKTWIYKPSLLWEVSGTENTKSINDVVSKQGSFALSAVPLNSDLSNIVPTVKDRVVINNTIDIGENVYYLTRYKGYFYANGEVIEYDAAQFSITGIGNVWISDDKEYQQYFSQVPFNGKIYPTGLLRIYVEPNYEIINGERKIKNGDVFDHGRQRFGTFISNHSAGLNSYWTDNANVRGCKMKSEYLFTTALEIEIPSNTVGAAGVDNVLAKQNSRTGIIRNFNATNYITEVELNKLKGTQSGSVQSSALVITGPKIENNKDSIDFVSYVYKSFGDERFRHFGTRMRIVGKVEDSQDKLQTPSGGSTYYQTSGIDPTKKIDISGGSGGIAVAINSETNNGYYFEIAALSENNIESYLKPDSSGNATTSISNMFFYKIKKNASNSEAIPVKLWSGLSKILVDDGNFVGQQRIAGEENPTVYDLAVEYQKFGSVLRFYLYINNKMVAIVDDNDPLPLYHNMALFVRGSSKCMFENVYGLTENYALNTVFTVGQPLAEVFGSQEINANQSLNKYAMNGIISSTYLSGINAQTGPKYNIYYEEFGTVLRECAYFNIRYDRAYPALYSKIAPTFNRTKGYTVSGYFGDSYGAEFFIFNSTDSLINLDETSGNFLRILGVTFTQDTTSEYSVDDYFNIKPRTADYELGSSSIVLSEKNENEEQNQIKISRLKYGKNDFSITSPYIQTESAAKDLMGWIVKKTMRPKKSVGVNIFATPILQLGDIVTIDYKNNIGIDMISPETVRFVVYNIEYSRSNAGPNMVVYLSEV
jgi:hypothetical protein